MPRIHINEWPFYSPSDQAKKDNVLAAARLMVNGALTAPVTGGVHGIEAEIAYGENELELIAREMERLAHQEVPAKLKKPFLYEAAMLRESDVVVFLGNFRVRNSPMDAGCGLCGGEPDCSFVYERIPNEDGLIDHTNRQRQTAINGPLCMLRAHDLGYAIGSALWLASTLFVDAKPRYSVGLAGRNLNICMKSEVVVGILLGVAAKNPYADIPTNYHLTNVTDQVDSLRKISIITRQMANHPYQTYDPGKQASGVSDQEAKEEE